MIQRPGYLLLEDGRRFDGTYIGRDDPSSGEAVFTTVMAGYHEVLTDPSFARQIVVMTAPMQGVYGVRDADAQARRSWVSGFVVRHLSTCTGSGPADATLPEYLAASGIPTLTGADTRAITRHIRDAGATRAAIAHVGVPAATAMEQLTSEPPMRGRDLATTVCTQTAFDWPPAGSGDGPPLETGRGLIVCLDYGVKLRSLDLIALAGYRVRVVPGTASAEDVRRLNPEGVFVSNGPGDPDAVPGAPEKLRAISEAGIPLFGICLGHQLLARAFGASNFKLPYGHRGGNHPVLDRASGTVEITSQNHGFAVAAGGDSIAGAPELEITHHNLNDGTVEGFRHRELPVFAVQYHPEAAPGPHDSRIAFDWFDSVRQERERSEESV